MNYKHLLLIVVSIFTTLSISAQDSTKKEFNSLEPFSNIEAVGVFSVKYEKGESFKVILEAKDAKDIENFKIRSKANILFLEYNTQMMSYVGMGNTKNNDMTVHIISPSLNDIKLEGVVSFTAEDISGNEIDWTINGMSVIEVSSVLATKFEIENKGVCTFDIKKSLSASEIELDFDGTTNANIASIETNDINIEAKGRTKIDISAMKSNEATIKSSGFAKMNINKIETSTLSVSNDSPKANITLSGSTNDYNKAENNAEGTIDDSKLIR